MLDATDKLQFLESQKFVSMNMAIITTPQKMKSWKIYIATSSGILLLVSQIKNIVHNENYN